MSLREHYESPVTDQALVGGIEIIGAVVVGLGNEPAETIHAAPPELFRPDSRSLMPAAGIKGS